MKRKTKWVIGICVAVFVVALGWFLMLGPAREWGPEIDGVRACVWLDSTNCTLGKPIRIRLALKNVSDEPVRVPKEIAFFYMTDHLFYGGEPICEGIGRGSFPKSADDFVVLQPGEEYEFPFSAEEMILSPKRCRKPGVYQYSFSAGGGSPRRRDGEMRTIWAFDSNTVTFTVRRWGVLPR